MDLTIDERPLLWPSANDKKNKSNVTFGD
jgi:hypothetical protein